MINTVILFLTVKEAVRSKDSGSVPALTSLKLRLRFRFRFFWVRFQSPLNNVFKNVRVYIAGIQ